MQEKFKQAQSVLNLNPNNCIICKDSSALVSGQETRTDLWKLYFPRSGFCIKLQNTRASWENHSKHESYMGPTSKLCLHTVLFVGEDFYEIKQSSIWCKNSLYFVRKKTLIPW